MRRLRNAACVLGTVIALTGLLAAPAEATDVPAYGSITISNPGTGFTVQSTYDPVLWGCSTTVYGQFTAPLEIDVSCAAPFQEGDRMVCPLMILTVHTAVAGRAGGRAYCSGGLDTGIISGSNTAQRTGNLGVARSVTCIAYGGGVPLVPPYTVTCNEPGLPPLD